MARARNIKPGFFQNENLVEYPFEIRLLFIGIWTLADKKGRLEDRPKKIKMGVFPADDVNVEAGLSMLAADKFIYRYSVDGVKYIQITNWEKHQSPHHTEKDSVIPPLNNGDETVKPQQQDGGNPPDSLIHRFSDSPIQNPLSEQAAAATDCPVDKSPAVVLLPAAVDQERAKTIADRLNGWAKKRGDPPNFQSIHPKIIEWVRRGVRDPHLKDAWENAEQARHRDGSAAPINPGFLHSFILDEMVETLLPPKAPDLCSICGAPATRKEGSAWFCSAHDRHSRKEDAA